jgi:hypothetical protein
VNPGFDNHRAALAAVRVLPGAAVVPHAFASSLSWAMLTDTLAAQGVSAHIGPGSPVAHLTLTATWARPRLSAAVGLVSAREGLRFAVTRSLTESRLRAFRVDGLAQGLAALEALAREGAAPTLVTLDADVTGAGLVAVARWGARPAQTQIASHNGPNPPTAGGVAGGLARMLPGAGGLLTLTRRGGAAALQTAGEAAAGTVAAGDGPLGRVVREALPRLGQWASQPLASRLVVAARRQLSARPEVAQKFLPGFGPAFLAVQWQAPSADVAALLAREGVTILAALGATDLGESLAQHVFALRAPTPSAPQGVFEAETIAHLADPWGTTAHRVASLDLWAEGDTCEPAMAQLAEGLSPLGWFTSRVIHWIPTRPGVAWVRCHLVGDGAYAPDVLRHRLRAAAVRAGLEPVEDVPADTTYPALTAALAPEPAPASAGEAAT